MRPSHICVVFEISAVALYCYLAVPLLPTASLPQDNFRSLHAEQCVTNQRAEESKV